MNPSIPTGKAVPADWLSNFDRYLISEGTHERAYEKLGAHLVEFAGEQGTVFAVWAPNARQVADRIRLAVNEPFHIQGVEHRISLSIGICLFRGSELAAETLIEHAEAAMYKAKQDGRNCIRFYDPVTQAALA